uniref:GntR family transcriptional regulator n=1 Tax=Amycolatopsis sp. CA-290885 TaxID=3239925 RepID=UPI003F490C98
MTGPGELQRGSAALEVARDMRTAIESGRYRHQQQLPTTRELAAQYGTSVHTINRAFAKLADEGLVVNQERVGRLVHYPGPDLAAVGARRTAPTVVLVGGYAGSGKTETGRIAARLTGWPMLDKDSLTRHVVEAMLVAMGQPAEDRVSEAYLTRVRPAEYESLREATLENLSCGNSVVMTAPFIRELADPQWCQRATADFAAYDAQLRTIWVRCDAESMRTYLTRRGAARDRDKLTNWQQYLSTVDLAFTPQMPHEVVDNSVQDPPLQTQVTNLLQRWGLHAR